MGPVRRRGHGQPDGHAAGRLPIPIRHRRRRRTARWHGRHQRRQSVRHWLGRRHRRRRWRLRRDGRRCGRERLHELPAKRRLVADIRRRATALSRAEDKWRHGVLEKARERDASVACVLHVQDRVVVRPGGRLRLLPAQRREGAFRAGRHGRLPVRKRNHAIRRHGVQHLPRRLRRLDQGRRT